MAEPVIDTSSLLAGIWQAAPPEFLNNISFILTLAKAAGIIFIIYLLFLIVQSFLSIKRALRLKAIDQHVAEINAKLDILVGKKTHTKVKPR